MLSIEKKKTDKLDLVAPISQFVKNRYGAQQWQDHEAAFKDLQNLRDQVTSTSDKSEGLRDMMYRYFALLQSVDTRLPISENNLRLSFTWYDGFKGKKSSSFSVSYERASILFNLGALLSQLGSSQNRATSDGLKASSQFFQAAAGTFEELKNELSIHPQPHAIDLTPEYATALENIMLAQAQECFYEKASKDNMKPSIVAKLSAQAADFYELAHSNLSGPLSPNIPKHWLPNLQLKAAMMKAATHFKMAASHLESKEYGLQASRLVVAVQLLDDAKKNFLKGQPEEAQASFNSLYTLISKSRDEAVKDNDTIYHETVVGPNQLPPVEKKAMVKSTPIPEAAKVTNETDPFVRLIPFAVSQKVTTYVERKDNLVRNEIRAVEEQNQIVFGTLQSCGLPGSIEASETPTGLPPSIAANNAQVRKDGGVKNLLELNDTLNKIAGVDDQMYKAAIAKLDEEEKEDEKCRGQFGGRWHRTPSRTLTNGLRNEANKHHNHFNAARKSDELIARRFQEHQEYILKLSETPDKLTAMLPNAATTTSLPEVGSLKQLLGGLDGLMADRKATRDQLQQLSQHDDITAKLIGAKQEDEVIFTQELAKYQPLRDKLAQSFQQQQGLLSQIASVNSQYVAKKQANNANKSREDMVQRFAMAFKAFNELRGNMREGIQFYTNFQELLKTFGRQVDDFVFARNTEKADLLREIQVAANSPVPSYSPNSPAFSPTGPYTPQGYPPQQPYPPQGYPPQQPYPPQGYPPQQPYPPQGYPPQQGYPYPPQQAYPPGYQQQPYPPQGYPPQQGYPYPPGQQYPPRK